MENDEQTTNVVSLHGALNLEHAKYRELIPECANESQQDEILEILWEIAGTLSRMRYGMEPIQNLFTQTLENSWTEAQSTLRQSEPANDNLYSDKKEAM